MLPLSRRCPDPALNRAISATDRARAANRLTALLTAACALALGLLAAVGVLALQLHFEARDRAQLQAHLQAVRALLVSVDNPGALAALPARLQATLGDEPALAVRVQGALGQPLYEQGADAAMPPALLARPRSAQPAPLVAWRHAGRSWRGSALQMRMPLDGAAPLTVALALDIEPHAAFARHFGWALAAYALLATAAFAALARWAAGRALAAAASR